MTATVYVSHNSIVFGSRVETAAFYTENGKIRDGVWAILCSNGKVSLTDNGRLRIEIPDRLAGFVWGFCCVGLGRGGSAPDPQHPDDAEWLNHLTQEGAGSVGQVGRKQDCPRRHIPCIHGLGLQRDLSQHTSPHYRPLLSTPGHLAHSNGNLAGAKGRTLAIQGEEIRPWGSESSLVICDSHPRDIREWAQLGLQLRVHTRVHNRSSLPSHTNGSLRLYDSSSHRRDGHRVLLAVVALCSHVASQTEGRAVLLEKDSESVGAKSKGEANRTYFETEPAPKLHSAKPLPFWPECEGQRQETKVKHEEIDNRHQPENFEDPHPDGRRSEVVNEREGVRRVQLKTDGDGGENTEDEDGFGFFLFQFIRIKRAWYLLQDHYTHLIFMLFTVSAVAIPIGTLLRLLGLRF